MRAPHRLIRLGLWGLAVAAAPACRAQDVPAEFDRFRRPAVAEPRVVVHPLDWERATRPADRFGPRALREADRRLLDAARAGRWAEVVELARSGAADADATDERGFSALVRAAHAGQIEAVRELLRRGAQIDRRGDDGFTPLGAAAFRGHAQLARQLLRAGADPAAWGSTGQTPLHLAALAGHGALLALLVRDGVPVDQLNSRRETALDLAAQGGQFAAMDALLAAGADMTRAGRR